MVHAHHLSNFLALLYKKNKSGQVTFTYKYLTKQILANVKFLVDFNIINGYNIIPDVSVINRFSIRVFLKYNVGEAPVIRDIKFFSRPGCTRILRLKDVKRLVKTKITSGASDVYVISTSSGLLSAVECLQHRVGGILLYYVSI